jgi:hypothetical protein
MATILWYIVDSITSDVFVVDSPTQPTTSPLSNPVDPNKTQLLNAVEKDLANNLIGYLVIDASGNAVGFTKSGTTFTRISQGVLYQMQVGSLLSAATLPLSGCGGEVVSTGTTLTTFQARRGTPGTSGTTTVQLEVNGVAVGGATLSWTSGDGAFALKSVAINVAVNAGDRLSMLLSSAEVGGQDIFGEVS